MTYIFYKREEIKEAKHEDRKPEQSFSLTSDIGSLKFYIKNLLLYEDFIWMENESYR